MTEDLNEKLQDACQLYLAVDPTTLRYLSMDEVARKVGLDEQWLRKNLPREVRLQRRRNPVNAPASARKDSATPQLYPEVNDVMDTLAKQRDDISEQIDSLQEAIKKLDPSEKAYVQLLDRLSELRQEQRDIFGITASFEISKKKALRQQDNAPQNDCRIATHGDIFDV